MESYIVKNQKRRKRKTRKSLDAIRKKARQSCLFDAHRKDCDAAINLKNKYFPPKTSVCITNKRLTLFRKAVRSDTVTRTVTSEVKNKTQAKDDNIDVLEHRAQPLKAQVIINSNNRSVNCVSYDNKNNSEKHTDKIPSSVILFSPSQLTEDSDVSEKLQLSKHQSDNMLSDSSSINNLYSENKLYNNFMNEIPNYLQQTASMFLKTDIIVHKCKNSLRNLYIEDDNFKNENSFFINDSYMTPRHPSHHTIKNPTDNIGYSYQELSKPELVWSPIPSMVSNSSIGRSSSPLSLITSDSPEYIYYPHRLNQ